MCCSVSGCVCQGYCDVEHELNAAVANCVVESVDVFVRGTVVFCGELKCLSWELCCCVSIVCWGYCHVKQWVECISGFIC